MMNALGHRVGGHGDMEELFGHVSAVAFQGGGAQRGPDEPFCNERIGGIECAQISVRLPLLKQ